MRFAVVLVALVVPARAVSFEEAKVDPAKRPAYLEQVLGPLVFHKDKNPQGIAAAWYSAADPATREKLKEEYKLDRREYAFDREIKSILASADHPAARVSAFFGQRIRVGSKRHQGLILAGDLFALAGEDEVKSAVEDYLAHYVKIWDAGLEVKDREVDFSMPALGEASDYVAMKTYAHSIQLENLLNGKRKVSAPFRQEALKNYLALHQKFMRQLAKEKKLYDDNNENALQKEIYDSFEFLRSVIHERIAAVGHEHKIVNKDTHEYALQPKK